jgi:hypothetical protein
VYGRKDAAWYTSYGYGCFTLSNDSNITADAIPTGLVLLPGLKYRSKDIF